MSDEAIRFEAFSCRHAGADVPAVRGVDLSVASGEMVVVAGPSGSGKSTLLRAACGLLPRFDGGTAAGQVTVGGLDTREHGPGSIGTVCGTVLQDPERQALMATVRAEISLPLESRGLSRPAAAAAVEETALLAGVEGILDRSLPSLSGGELQRVAIAAALAPGPRILLLDEPTSQLDPVAADDLVWLLRRLNEEQGITVVVAEQRLERLLPAADRVVVMNEGRVACDLPPREFLGWAAGRAPALQTPAGVLFEQAGLPAPPTTVKEARAELSTRGLIPTRAPGREDAAASPGSSRRRLRRSRSAAVLRFEHVWDEPRSSRPLLADIGIELEAGETVALMGRNGAGKSTLLRHAAGLRRPSRGRVRLEGVAAMLTQNPGDHLVAETVGDLLADGPASVALDRSRNPKDLSGGERQWLAFELVTAAARDCSLLLLDEPTRGLDRARRAELAERVSAEAEGGKAVIVATHDSELAAQVADRVILMAEGKVLADGGPSELLSRGWHFTTETARILGPGSGALLPADGASLLVREGGVRS